MRVTSLRCIFCHGLVAYTAKDRNRLDAHMSMEHGVDYDFNYILASCLMSQGERDAIAAIIEERENKKSKSKNDLVNITNVRDNEEIKIEGVAETVEVECDPNVLEKFLVDDVTPESDLDDIVKPTKKVTSSKEDAKRKWRVHFKDEQGDIKNTKETKPKKKKISIAEKNDDTETIDDNLISQNVEEERSSEVSTNDLGNKQDNVRSKLIAESDYFKEHSNIVRPYIENSHHLTEADNFPSGWMMFEYFQNSGKRRLSFVTPNRDLCFKTRVGALEYLKFLDLVPKEGGNDCSKKAIDQQKSSCEENEPIIVVEEGREERKTKKGKENAGEDFLGQLTKKVVEMKKRYEIQEVEDDNEIGNVIIDGKHEETKLKTSEGELVDQINEELVKVESTKKRKSKNNLSNLDKKLETESALEIDEILDNSVEQTTQGEESVRCENCNIDFVNEKRLLIHKNKCNNKELSNVEVIDSIANSEVSTNHEVDSKLSESIKKSFNCSYCEKEFNNRKSLWLHKKNKHQEELFIENLKKKLSSDKEDVNDKPIDESVSSTDDSRNDTLDDTCKWCGDIFENDEDMKKHSCKQTQISHITDDKNRTKNMKVESVDDKDESLMESSIDTRSNLNIKDESLTLDEQSVDENLEDSIGDIDSNINNLDEKMSEKVHIIKNCPYFESHPRDIFNFHGGIELEESSSLPPGWMVGTKIGLTGRKVPTFVSPGRILSFRTKISVFEYIKFQGKCSKEELAKYSEMLKIKT